MSSRYSSANNGRESQAQKSQKGRKSHQGQTPKLQVHRSIRKLLFDALKSPVWFRDGNIIFTEGGSEREMDLDGFVRYMYSRPYLQVFPDHMGVLYLAPQKFPPGGFAKFIAKIAQGTENQGKKWTPEGWVEWPASTHAAAAAVVSDDDGWHQVLRTQRPQRKRGAPIWLEQECSNKNNCMYGCGHNHGCLGMAQYADGKFVGHSVSSSFTHPKLCPNDRPLVGKRCQDTHCLLDHCKGRWNWMHSRQQHHAVKQTAPPAPQQVLSVVPTEDFPQLPTHVRKLMKPYPGPSGAGGTREAREVSSQDEATEAGKSQSEYFTRYTMSEPGQCEKMGVVTLSLQRAPNSPPTPTKPDDAADTLDKVFGSQVAQVAAPSRPPPRHTPAISFRGRTPEERAEAEHLVGVLFGDSTRERTACPASSTSPPLPAKAKVVTTVAEKSQAVLQAAREKKKGKGKKKGKKSPAQGHSLSDRL